MSSSGAFRRFPPITVRYHKGSLLVLSQHVQELEAPCGGVKTGIQFTKGIVKVSVRGDSNDWLIFPGSNLRSPVIVLSQRAQHDGEDLSSSTV